jgi:hypothetical protein
MMTYGNYWDSLRLNSLTQGDRGIDHGHKEAFRVYKLKGVTLAPMLAGLAFSVVTAVLFSFISENPESEHLCLAGKTAVIGVPSGSSATTKAAASTSD